MGQGRMSAARHSPADAERKRRLRNERQKRYYARQNPYRREKVAPVPTTDEIRCNAYRPALVRGVRCTQPAKIGIAIAAMLKDTARDHSRQRKENLLCVRRCAACPILDLLCAEHGALARIRRGGLFCLLGQPVPPTHMDFDLWLGKAFLYDRIIPVALDPLNISAALSSPGLPGWPVPSSLKIMR